MVIAIVPREIHTVNADIPAEVVNDFVRVTAEMIRLAEALKLLTPEHRRQIVARLGEPAATLTRRETEMLHLLAQGVGSVQELGRRMGITYATARSHTRSILGKLEAHSMLEAVAVAKRQGILDRV